MSATKTKPKDISDAVAAGADITPETAEKHLKKYPPQKPKPPKPPKPSPEGGSGGVLGSSGGFGFGGGEKMSFPTADLPPAVRETVRAFSEVAMVPESLAATAVFGATSAAAGAAMSMPSIGKLSVRANIYQIAIAESGSGKDMVFNLAFEPLKAEELARMEEWSSKTKPDLLGDLADIKVRTKEEEKRKAETPQEKAERRDALRGLERERREIEDKLRAEPNLLVNDVTREGLANIMASQPGEAVASASPEARGIRSIIKGRYSKGDDGSEDFYTGAYTGTSLKVNRASREHDTIFLKRPCLSVTWMLQHDSWAELAGDTAMVESGLLPRCLAHNANALPEQFPENFPVVPTSIERRWSDTLGALLAYRDAEPVVVGIDAEASRALLGFHNGLRQAAKDGDLKNLRPFAARWGENAWRLALVIHAAEHGANSHLRQVSGETAKAAVGAIRWFIQETRDLLAAGLEERQYERATKLWQVVKREGGEKTLRELRKCNGFAEAEVVELAARPGSGLEVIEHKPEGGGRPSLKCVTTQ